MKDMFAWCTAEEPGQNNGHFLQVTLTKPHTITAIATMGFHTAYVTKYRIEYEVNNVFQRYKDNDGSEVRAENNSEGIFVGVGSRT